MNRARAAFEPPARPTTYIVRSRPTLLQTGHGVPILTEEACPRIVAGVMKRRLRSAAASSWAHYIRPGSVFCGF
jgi:hypothetical protein